MKAIRMVGPKPKVQRSKVQGLKAAILIQIAGSIRADVEMGRSDLRESAFICVLFF
jgi:hypothetical protein